MIWFILLGIVILTAGILIRSGYERKQLSTEIFSWRSEKIKKGTKITAVFLSDLHNQVYGEDNQELIQAIQAVRPDLILAGGDLMICKGKKGIDVPVALMEKLSAEYPVFCGNGNHELRMRRRREVYGDQYEEYTSRLRQMGVCYLENQLQSIRIGENQLQVGSVDLDRKYFKRFTGTDMEPSYLTEKLGRPDPGLFQITMIHSPEYLNAAAAWGSDLVLSGHYHGGTVRLPGVGAIISPAFHVFPKYAGGEFKKDKCRMIVSRGLGTHSVNIRINNLPQLVVIEIYN